MQKNFFYTFIITVSVVCFAKLLYAKDMNQNKDFVPDEATAIKIAEAIWLPIYGDKIYNDKPFVAKLSNQKVWIVEGTLHEAKGGVPHIEIQKKDCKIIKVYHEK